MKRNLKGRLLSLFLSAAMVLTMLPSDTLTLQTQAAGVETSAQTLEDSIARETQGMDVTVHVYNGADGGLGYDDVYLQYWQTETATVTGAEKQHFAPWNVDVYKCNNDGDGWYSFHIQGAVEGFQFLSSTGQPNTGGKGYEVAMADYQGELWYKNYKLYKDASCMETLTEQTASFQGEAPFLLVGGVPGTAWDPNLEPNFVQDAENTNKYVATLEKVPAGNYEYKVLQNPAVNGWGKAWALVDSNRKLSVSATADVSFTLFDNDADMNVEVSFAYCTDIVMPEFPENIKKGTTIKLPTEAIVFGTDGSKLENQEVAYSTTAKNVTIDANELTVDNSYEGESLVVTATCGEVTKDFTLQVLDIIYEYTVYYYNPEYNKDTADLWVWETNGAGANQGTPFTDEEVLEDGNTWMKAVLPLSYQKVSIIPRTAGEWKWQDETRTYNNKAGKEKLTFYMVVGDSTMYTELPTIKEQEKRSLIVEYKRNSGSAKDWYFYTWNNGGLDFNPFEQVNNSWIATVPVKAGLSSVSFCLERADVTDGVVTHWAEKDGNDYLCQMPVDQNVVKIVIDEGKGITKTYAYNKGMELDTKNKMIHFYYRDNAKFAADQTNDFASVEVEINGKRHAMKYDAKEQRYTYDEKNLKAGDYLYRYITKESKDAEEQVVLDAYNDETVEKDGATYSLCRYATFKAKVSATVYNPSMSYIDNNVLQIQVTDEKGNELTDMEVVSAEANLSALGCDANTAIDPELLELTIAVKEGTTAGQKTIPVTVYDQYNNAYKTSTTVKVVKREKANDFDWDEALIYFAVTDRFFDGNEANNENVDKAGSLSYHGGDFAGLTSKLDYLQDLGVNTIWITPIVANDMEAGLKTDLEGVTSWGYHGYWASDFEKIDKHLGTEQEFAALLEEAHKRGMKLMVDVVLNHSGYGDATEEYFNSMLKDADGNPVSMIRTDEEMITGNDQKTSLAGLPDFLTENAEVRELLVEWQSNWISKYPIDYYRVDTVKHVDDTTWSAFKNALTKINPKFKMIGEWSGAGYATETGMLRTGRMDSLLDFDFNDQAESFVNGNMSSVESFLTGRNQAINNTATMGQFLSSHDENGLQYKLINQDKLSEDRARELFKVAASLQLTAKGQPVIYYGEEVGQYGADNYPYQTNRYDLDWENANEENDMFAHYKKMIAIRNAYTQVFAKGTRTTIDANNEEGYDVFARSYQGTNVIVGLNNNTEAKEVSLTGRFKANIWVKDCYSDTKYATDNKGNVTITIPAAKEGGTVVLVETKEAATGLCIAPIDAKTYTGKAITLAENELVVSMNGKTLTYKKDYSVSYSANTKAGEAKVVVTGKGNYSKKKATATFTILPKNLEGATVTYQAMITYNKKNLSAQAKVTDGKTTLKANKDYKISYFKAEDTARTNPLKAMKEVGQYTMVIAAVDKGNYIGQLEKEVEVTLKNSIAKATVSFNKTKITYQEYEKEIKPEVTQVKVGRSVIPATDYEVTYDMDWDTGVVTVTITMKEAAPDFFGTISKKITCKKADLKSVIKLANVEKLTFDPVEAASETGMVQKNQIVVMKAEGADDLLENKDYMIKYSNNQKAGTATIKVTGIHGYSGTLTKTFQISRKTVTAEDELLSIQYDRVVIYDKKGAKPAVEVSYHGVVLTKKDYKVTYKNYNQITTEKTKKPTLTIEFLGNYQGKITKEYQIVAETVK